ncbi:histidine kinase [Bacillus sp. UMB0899]|uniref:sensor histidine kinase n=1 Tax=Metabacillus schmidteae TaxID=2730405 RepID=UPI000C80EC70|nr:sensor histidine kinase [Metabacillus schmidteae]PMC35924.1 histidine kinase [Bacillus sp. UMB0899]
MKKMYLIWLAINCTVWTVAFFEIPTRINEWQLLGTSLFLLIFFFLPLFREKPILQTLFFCIQALLTTIIFYPIDSLLNPYSFLIHSLLIAEAVYYLPRLKGFLVVVVQTGCLTSLVLQSNLTVPHITWYTFFYFLLISALFHYHGVHKREKETRQKNDALLDEYRKMKRQLVMAEEQTRQDERMLIGHEIHDSVGHKLTALIMQFEVFRIQADEKDQEKIATLKQLAEQSLEETRSAVKSFKQPEVGGLQGVIRLIRKLEMENFMKINFSVKHGAFAVPLTGEQSFAIYRAVQEALTNIMKHSSAREAHVSFESPGGSIFRFEVFNEAPSHSTFHEGYGLKAMRDRLEKVGGSLEIDQNERHFIVRGSIRLIERRVSYD